MASREEDYPDLNAEQSWPIFVGAIQTCAAGCDIAGPLQRIRRVFDDTFAVLQAEHSTVKNKYYHNGQGRGIVNLLHLEHFVRLTYAVSRRLFLQNHPRFLLDILFLAIKTRGMIDMFYEFDLPPVFLPFHAFGTVLGRASYGRDMIVTQHCTIGNNHGEYPVFGDAVILRPGAMVLGKCRIGSNVQIGAGALVIDRDIPDNTLVFGRPPALTVKPNPCDNRAQYFV